MELEFSNPQDRGQGSQAGTAYPALHSCGWKSNHVCGLETRGRRGAPLYCAGVSTYRSGVTEPVRPAGRCPGPSTRARRRARPAPARASAAVTAPFTSAAVQSLRGSEGAERLGRSPGSSLGREEARRGHGAHHEREQRQWSPATPIPPRDRRRGAASRRGARSTSSGPGSYTW